MVNIASNKNLSIETLRGLAILLVVAGHVIGSDPSGGMQIDFPSVWRYLYTWIDYIQMPLFTAIAGWVYALKPAGRVGLGTFTVKKVRRLLVPMITVGTIYFIVQYIMPGTNAKGVLSEIWRIYIFPYTIYWYLPSLFLIFVAMAFVDSKSGADTFLKWGVVMAISYCMMLAQQSIIPYSVPNLFSFKGALLQLPYFVLGVGVKRFSDMIFSSKLKTIYVLLAIAGLALLQVEWFYPLKESVSYLSVRPLFVIATLLLLLHCGCSSRWLTWVGSYTYAIYLFRVFGTAGGRIIMVKCGVGSEIVIFLFAFTIAVLCPIIADKILTRYKLTRILLLGELK